MYQEEINTRLRPPLGFILVALDVGSYPDIVKPVICTDGGILKPAIYLRMKGRTKRQCFSLLV